MKKVIILILVLTSNLFYTQNLVLNPSFEDYKKCPSLIGQFNNNLSYWSIPNIGTTDYFNACSNRIGIKNYNGKQIPKSGKGFAGIYVYAPGNYREYIQGQLSKSLEKGKKYEITFYVSLSLYSTHAIKDFKVLFTEERLGLHKKKKESRAGTILTNRKLNSKLYTNISEKYINPSKLTDKPFDFYQLEGERVYSKKGSWMKVSMTIEAKGYENYITIGNFESGRKLRKQEILPFKSNYFSYYYIDDVSVEPLEKETPESLIVQTTTTEKKKLIQENRIYIFKNVLFDFDKAELLGVSLNELDELYKYLDSNPNLQIEIYGHTDNIGANKRNEKLSQERAKAVADYLIAKGLDKERIKWEGYGSSQPIADNITEEGRAENRRVAFKLLEN